VDGKAIVVLMIRHATGSEGGGSAAAVYMPEGTRVHAEHGRML